jgi:riboflavin kinase/FMN adenylyltransferase
MFRVYRSLGEIGPEARPSAVSIGNFDGMHAGHRRLLARNLELAREHRSIPSALTFEPHPARVVAPHRAPKLLTTTEQRLELIRAAGIEQVFVLPFDERFSEFTPLQFARDVLIAACGARVVLVGDNFRFGHRKAGTVEALRHFGERLGFVTEIVPAVVIRGHVVSSTAIRQLLEKGAVSAACRLLGRPYWIEGTVVRGFGIGAKQTVPTINLDTSAEVIPERGVYISRTHDRDGGRSWPSITNIGVRPTFGGETQTVETFLLAPLEGPTPQHIRLEFLRRVREERKFESPAALKQQIMRDVARAQAWFRRTDALAGHQPAL